MACHETSIAKAHNDQSVDLPAPNKLGSSFDALCNKAVQILARGAPKTTENDIFALLSHYAPLKSNKSLIRVQVSISCMNSASLIVSPVAREAPATPTMRPR